MKKGTITSVNVDKQQREVYVTIVVDIGQEHRDLPLRMPGKGLYYVPEIGDQAVIYDEGDGVYAVMHPRAGSTDSPPLPDIGGGEYAISIDDNTSIVITKDGTITVDADTVSFGNGGTSIIKDVAVNTVKDADGHVTDVSLDITRSNTTETE